VTATELRDDIIRALREDSLPACRRKYSDAQLLIIDDLHGLAGHPATQVEAGLLVSACLGAGGTVACAATCRRAELDDFAMFRRSARGARLFEIRRPSPRHMARIIGHLARIGGVTVATRAADRIARHSRGDVRRAMGEVAGQKLQQALSVGR
jgi:chromosomal replication initiation ATPase DnaA